MLCYILFWIFNGITFDSSNKSIFRFLWRWRVEKKMYEIGAGPGHNLSLSLSSIFNKTFLVTRTHHVWNEIMHHLKETDANERATKTDCISYYYNFLFESMRISKYLRKRKKMKFYLFKKENKPFKINGTGWKH